MTSVYAFLLRKIDFADAFEKERFTYGSDVVFSERQLSAEGLSSFVDGWDCYLAFAYD